MKQVGPVAGVVPPFAIEPPVEERGQPTTRVGLNDDGVIEVSPNMPSSILAKRKRDDNFGVSGRKKSRAPFSL